MLRYTSFDDDGQINVASSVDPDANETFEFSASCMETMFGLGTQAEAEYLLSIMNRDPKPSKVTAKRLAKEKITPEIEAVSFWIHMRIARLHEIEHDAYMSARA